MIHKCICMNLIDTTARWVVICHLLFSHKIQNTNKQQREYDLNAIAFFLVVFCITSSLKFILFQYLAANHLSTLSFRTNPEFSLVLWISSAGFLVPIGFPDLALHLRRFSPHWGLAPMFPDRWNLPPSGWAAFHLGTLVPYLPEWVEHGDETMGAEARYLGCRILARVASA